MNVSNNSTNTLVEASLSRKLLPVKVLLVNASLTILFYVAIAQLEKLQIEWPTGEIAEIVGTLLIFSPAIGFFVILAPCFTDVAIHTIRNRKLLRLIGLKTGLKEKAEWFEGNATTFIYIGFIFPLSMMALGLLLLMLFGGIAVGGAAIAATFSGWPSWAIVIIVLLIVLLLKK